MKLIGKDGKEIEVEAKIDTGADSSAIDCTLAEELGYSDVLAYFDTIPIPQFDDRDEARAFEEKLRGEHIGKHPDLVDILCIYASNGMSVRPKIPLKLIIDKEEIEARPSVVDRTALQYRAIIGRRNLGKFLVDVTK